MKQSRNKSVGVERKLIKCLQDRPQRFRADICSLSQPLRQQQALINLS